MRRREPPFIGGEEGVFEKGFILTWQAPNRPQGTLNPGITL
jgi:hypothetical protein